MFLIRELIYRGGWIVGEATQPVNLFESARSVETKATTALGLRNGFHIFAVVALSMPLTIRC